MNLDDYDEFGNYIGAALSDEESDGAGEYAANGFGAPGPSTAQASVSRGGVTVEDDVDDRLEGFDDEAGMDVDGASISFGHVTGRTVLSRDCRFGLAFRLMRC